MTDQEQKPAAMPTTVEEALQLMKEVTIPSEEFLNWLRALGSIPCQFGAALYVAMNGRLNMSLEIALRKNASAVQRD